MFVDFIFVIDFSFIFLPNLQKTNFILYGWKDVLLIEGVQMYKN